jgi:putative aldouronate transport system permease protein
LGRRYFEQGKTVVNTENLCNNLFKIRGLIYIPLSKAAPATVTLFVLINHWNARFDGLIYNNNRPEGYPLQSYMRTVLVRADFSLLSITEMELFAEVSDRPLRPPRSFGG